MNLTVYFIMLLITYSLQTLCTQQLPAQLPAGLTLVFNNNNDNKNSAATYTQTNSENSTEKQKSEKSYKKCYQFFGKELKECMDCLCSQDFNKALCKMNSRQRRTYLHQLSSSTLKQLKSDCSDDTWASLQSQDPACISTIEDAIKEHDNQKSSTARDVLGCLIFIIGICCGV